MTRALHHGAAACSAAQRVARRAVHARVPSLAGVDVLTQVLYIFWLLCFFGGYGLEVYRGRVALWGHVSFWLYTVLVFSVAGSVGIVTVVFWLSAHELADAIERLAVWDQRQLLALAASGEGGDRQGAGAETKGTNKGKSNPLAPAYQNFLVLRRTVERFADAWGPFVFVAEFGLVVSTGLFGVASVDESVSLIVLATQHGGAAVPAPLDLAAQALRAAFMVVSALAYGAFVFGVLSAAAAVSSRAKRVQARAHALVARLEEANADHALLAQARAFYAHVASEGHAVRFASLGITIDSTFMAQFCYLGISAYATYVVVHTKVFFS